MPRLPTTSAPADEYTSTARFLSSTRLPSPPRWSSMRTRASSTRERILSLHPTLRSTHDRVLTLLVGLSATQRLLLAAALGVLALLSVLTLTYHTAVLHALRPLAGSARASRTAWLIPFALVVLVSFPPLIGYSTLLTLSGFVFGVGRGYALVAPATVVGSTLSFVACRTRLRDFSERLARSDGRFGALAAVLEKDGLPLLVCIRLCPLPYSLSNGAISTIPSVKVWQFALATGLATPRLLVGLFIGARLADLAEEGEKMGLGTRVLSWVSVLVGVGIGVGTGWWMYGRVKRRAEEIERERRVEEGGDGVGAAAAGEVDWVDDDEEEEDGDEHGVRERDAISLHTAAGHDEEDQGDRNAQQGIYKDVGDEGDDAGWGEQKPAGRTSRYTDEEDSDDENDERRGRSRS